MHPTIVRHIVFISTGLIVGWFIGGCLREPATPPAVTLVPAIVTDKAPTQHDVNQNLIKIVERLLEQIDAIHQREAGYLKMFQDLDSKVQRLQNQMVALAPPGIPIGEPVGELLPKPRELATLSIIYKRKEGDPLYTSWPHLSDGRRLIWMTAGDKVLVPDFVDDGLKQVPYIPSDQLEKAWLKGVPGVYKIEVTPNDLERLKQYKK